jgi:hypothetical protein
MTLGWALGSSVLASYVLIRLWVWGKSILR